MGKLTVVVGGQFGSEAKGHVTAKLIRTYKDEYRHSNVIVRVGGPNAGHSAVGILDRKTWALRQIPVGAVVDLDAELVIGAGSEIDPEVLTREVSELDQAGYQVSDRLHIDAETTVIWPAHAEQEKMMNGLKINDQSLVTRVGSTGKGIGASRADRIWRQAQRWSDIDDGGIDTVNLMYRRLADSDTHVTVEGTQGYGLGLHAGFYPQCTSSDCRAIDFLAMAGLSPWHGFVDSLAVWVVARTFPIRVAGNSGPLYGELTWDQMREITGIPDLEPELTTVTKLQRRIGMFDKLLVANAMSANGGQNANLALTFADYVDPDLVNTNAPVMSEKLHAWWEANLKPHPIDMVTWGPDSASIYHERAIG